MITRVFIVEDELIHAEALKIVMEELGFELAGECDNADDAYELIKTANPDVLLVDIALPGVLNGITLAEKVKRELGIPHIFTTSFTQEDIMDQAVSTNPAAYLRKPVDASNLRAAIKIALQNSSEAHSQIPETLKDHFFTKIGNKLVRINFSDVLIIKADGENFISLVTEKKETACRVTLKEIYKLLPDNFIQVHRGYFINMEHLEMFNELEQTAILKGHHAPVARSYKKAFLQRIQRL